MKPDERSMAHLTARAQAGDREAYRTLLIECRTWLGAYFAGKVPQQLRDDLIQDTLLSLHRKLATYDSKRAFLPWLAAIARYRWVDQLRRLYRKPETLLDENHAAWSDEPAIAARISLERLLARLPAGQAEAIELVKIEGLSISEAASASGQTESLVKVNIHRGLKRLAASIESE
ncbi:sigma-70 family RNA polymerase sigma factor [Sphingomonas sp. AX6]|uniref:sigma-70 family RNA polymerase sigma factor n=1 Tax=Sphingomonas sp. AX6 TaxID=2653171 RepID=UPI0012F2467D|nr:sigma-70 family RNA polymerase sigma factor [Sphingomonas sp. AX6]VXC96070.1 RNA polymerase, sigma-24 subunit, ECF subfamily [Sphingomonas sp. AX6]